MDNAMATIWNALWEGLCIYTQWECTHFLKTKYIIAFIMVGIPFLEIGIPLLKLLPSFIMPHLIEMGDVSEEVKRRAQKEFKEIQSTIDKEALK